MEDKVRMVGVRRWFAHTRVDPTWANPGHPSPLSVPLRPYLPGFPVSGTARVPAPLWKRRAIRRVKKRPRYRVYAAASTTLLPLFGTADETFAKFAGPLYTYPHAPVKCRASNCSSSRTRLPAGEGGDGDHTRPLQKGCWGNVALSLPMGPPFRIMPCILYWQMR